MPIEANRDLPVGTITFLFTDIEGSTRLLGELEHDYDGVLAEHGRRIRAAIEAHRGIEVNTEGDAFFVVFTSPTDAVSAAVDAQRALMAGSWPHDADVRVRMGLHSGEGRLGGDDYIGMDVNRAARIAAAANGGQVLLSESTSALVKSRLSDDVSMRDLGRHRLKDLPETERIWQVDIDGLPFDFPAIRTLDARPSNLPLAPTPLVGREADIAALRGVLTERRLATLTGPGGTGKTRLATATASSLLDEYPEGVYFAALEEARDRASLASETAAAMGIRERPDRDLEDSIRSYLRDRKVLLVLDNFEQVVREAAFVPQVLLRAPGVRVIATSREPLRVTGEQEYPVSPLATPGGNGTSSVEELAASEAVALFVARARDVRPDFELTEANAAAVARITERLDGLPLAVELAAARVRLMTPQAILDRFDERLPLLTGGSRDRPVRQQTLEGAIDWSYDILEEPERRLFEHLSVFAGGWTLETAEEVCGDPDHGINVLDGLSSLVEKSLIRSLDTPAEPRFAMLQVIREYAAAKLAGRQDAQAIARAHARWARRLVEAARPELVLADLRSWQDRLHAEEENIRAAMRWAIDYEETQVALALTGSLWRFWQYWATAREGTAWLEAALAMPRQAEYPDERARALSGLAGLVYWQGQMKYAAELYGEIIAIRRQMGDPHELAVALSDAMWTALATGEMEQAMGRAREAIELYRATGDETGAILTEAWIAVTAMLNQQGADAEAAINAARRAADASRAAGRALDESDWLSSMGYMARTSGDAELADEYNFAAFRLLDRLGAIGWMAPYFKFFAARENSAGRYERAATLGAAAERYSEEIGGELPESMQQAGDPIELARAQLEPDVHAQAVARGRAMTFEEVAAYILDEDPRRVALDRG